MVRFVGVLVLTLLAALTRSVSAQQEVDDEATTRSRSLFTQGVTHVKAQEWGQALEAFEQAAALRPHAVTSFNIAVCHRAMARYTRARQRLREALRRNEAARGELSDDFVEESTRYLSEIDGLLAHVRLTLAPSDARLAVDGSPIAVEPGERGGVRGVAGIRPAGAGEKAPSSTVELLLDPGVHVIVVSHAGFSDAVENVTLAPGAVDDLTVELQRRAARLRIRADQPAAIVAVNGREIGPAPLDIRRPAGRYDMLVRADGYEAYQTQVMLQPGDDVTLRATLVEATPSVLERWWFWTAAGVVVTGAVIGTYFAVRPEPERPAPDGGGLGWVLVIR